MCFFISIVTKGGDTKAIDMALRRHGRQARPIDNASVRKALQTGEKHFLTTVGCCDCGTALSPKEFVGEKMKRRESQQAAKLRKKGWSETKIERWIADRKKADERTEEQNQINSPDSVDLWKRVIDDVMAIAGVNHAGILLHFYSGDIEDEEIAPVRESVSIRDFTSRLRNFEEDQLLIAIPT